jgi:alpha-glucuronidase
MNTPKLENGYEGWLRYAAVTDERLLESYRAWGRELVVPDTATEVLQAAAAELTAGLASLLGAAPVRTAATQGGQFILLNVRGDAPKIDKG